jgi:hypothetical protein
VIVPQANTRFTPVRAVKDGLLIGACYMAARVTIGAVSSFGFGYDAHAYWAAWNRPEVYLGSANVKDAFLYSPAFAQAIWPFAQLPWSGFILVWTLANVVALAWLLAPLPPLRRVLIGVLLTPVVIAGNVWAFFAVVLVVRLPEAWVLPLLTKITAAVGLVWYAVRREWWKLARVGVAAAVIAGVSYAAAPQLWHDWVAVLRESSQSPLNWKNLFPGVRVPLGLLLAAYAARTNRSRLLPWAMIAACPVFSLPNLGVLAALPRLRERPVGEMAPPERVEARAARVAAPVGSA